MKNLTTPQAVLIGAVILAISLYFAATTGYRYQLISSSSPSLMWKIDKFTGETWECYVSVSPLRGCHLVSD